MIVFYPFTEEDSAKAFDEWGANCGPNALAFALQVPIESVRGKIHEFDEKRYTSPTMMKHVIAEMGRQFRAMSAPMGESLDVMIFGPCLAVVRIQWTGPWTSEGANPKWAYRQTHWITTWADAGNPMVFDVNGGIMEFHRWCNEIVPLLTAETPRADGGWFPTHVWRIDPVKSSTSITSRDFAESHS